MAGEHGFNQVFFDNVRIPKENLVGELNRGWYQVAVALDFERSSISGFAGSRRVLEKLVQFAREHPQTIRNNPAMRYRLVDMAMEINVGTYMSYRIVGMQSRGIVPNYEASMAKVFASEQSQRLARTGMQLLGMYSQLEPGSRWAPLKGRIERMYLTSVSSTIGGGTSEIQRNIIATRGLGLPRG
jgi:alkylation response protein AidB-like acyl-CoA dehydrogenase